MSKQQEKMGIELSSRHRIAKVIGVLSLFAFASAASAIPKGPCDPVNENICCEDPMPLTFAFAYPLDLELNCPRDFYVSIQGLAFQAKQDGMEFAIEDTSGNGQTPLAPIQYGKVIGFSGSQGKWDYNPGLRFGVGFYVDHDAWNVDGTWTWLNITNYQHAKATTSQGVLIPLWVLGSGTPNGGVLYNSESTCDLYVVANLFGPDASAVWKASYNVLDLQLRKPYYVSRYLVFKPHFGLRGGSINQHFSVDYGGGYASSGITGCSACSSVTCPTMGSGRTIHHGDNDFRGIGVRAGIDTDWIVGKGWSLLGSISASMLSGKFSISQNMILPQGITCPDLLTCVNANCQNAASVVSLIDGYDFNDEFYQNIPNLEMSLGLSWDRKFDKDRYCFRVEAAYEFIAWWNMLQMRKFYSSTSSTYLPDQAGCDTVSVPQGSANDVVSRGNLTLNGFSLRLQLDF